MHSFTRLGAVLFSLLPLLLLACESPDASDPLDPGPCELETAPEGFPTTAVGVTVGATIADFSRCLADEEAREFHAYGSLGNVVLINLGAGWCPPCKAEAPSIQDLYETYKDEGFTVLMGMGEGWASGSSPSTLFLSDWKSTYGITFPVVADPTWSLGQYYQAGDEGYIPLNVIVDRDGVIRSSSVGGLSLTAAASVIEAALAQEATLDY